MYLFANIRIACICAVVQKTELFQVPSESLLHGSDTHWLSLQANLKLLDHCRAELQTQDPELINNWYRHLYRRKASVHLARNCLCFHFAVYPTNESCLQRSKCCLEAQGVHRYVQTRSSQCSCLSPQEIQYPRWGYIGGYKMHYRNTVSPYSLGNRVWGYHIHQ